MEHGICILEGKYAEVAYELKTRYDKKFHDLYVEFMRLSFALELGNWKV